MVIQLLIAEDHPWVREGLRATFEDTEIEINNEATTGDEAVQMALTGDADVMLLDIKMPQRDGFEVLQAVKPKKPALHIVIYTQHERTSFQDRARQLGASGYLHKRAAPEDLIDAVRRVNRGEDLWISSKGNEYTN